MPALSLQIWNIEPTLDISSIDDGEILSLFWNSRTSEEKQAIDDSVDAMIAQGKTEKWQRANLVDKTSRRIGRAREFVSVADAQQWIDWYIPNIPAVNPTNGPVLFTRTSMVAIDNMTLDQFIENWPNV